MTTNKKASHPISHTGGRQTEKIAAEQLIPRLYCITRAGGVQAARRQPPIDRRHIVGEAKREYEWLQSRRQEPCSYDVFVETVMEALKL